MEGNDLSGWLSILGTVLLNLFILLGGAWWLRRSISRLPDDASSYDVGADDCSDFDVRTDEVQRDVGGDGESLGKFDIYGPFDRDRDG